MKIKKNNNGKIKKRIAERIIGDFKSIMYSSIIVNSSNTSTKIDQ